MAELSVMTVLILFCIFRTMRSRKEIGRPVVLFLAAIVIPLLGNIVIASSEDPVVCNAGYLLYLLGTNVVLYTLLDFTLHYCAYPPMKKTWRVIITAVLVGDSVSVFLNNFFLHCYLPEEQPLSSGEVYYVLQSKPGHLIHLGISAILLLLIAGLYLWRIFQSPLLYLERYLVIFLCIVFVALCEYYNVLMDRTIDQSMVGLAVGGILVYFFAIEYSQVFVKMALHDLLVTNMADAVIFFDRDGHAVYANHAAATMFGITKEKLGQSAQLLGTEITGNEFLEDGRRVRADFRRQSEIGEGDGKRFCDVTCQRMEDRRGNYLGAFFEIKDYTDVERGRRESLFRQTHDQLTGMQNREMFIDQVNDMLRDAPDEDYVMILSDIADFKIINDIYGREAGDRILLGIAGSIRALANERSLFCRWGGDQFAAFARKGDISPEALEKKIRQGMKSVENKSFKYPVIVHAGYYEVTEKDTPVSIMVDRCIMAIAMVHDDYQRIVGIYDEELRQKRLWEQKISAQLPAALSERQIFPYLQPQYNSENELTGAEVLVRWQHPEEGFLAPYRFIPILEKNGMIVRVDAFIWEEACRILSAWRGTPKERLHLSVNISPKDFYFIDIYETFTGLVEKYGLAPGSLHLEITETVVMNDAAENIRTINRLREYGFIVEMDDFGSGYSSLNLLRDMPVDVLKIDMAFLGRTTHPKKAELILNNVIELAHRLDMISIAEGIELKNQLDMLKQMGGNVFQGYYFAKPMPLGDFEKLAA